MEGNKNFTIKHTYDKKNKVLIKAFEGTVYMDDVIESWRTDMENKRVTIELKAVITDFKRVNNKANISELNKITDFYKEHFEIFKDMKLAVVIDSPPGVAMLYLFEKKNDEFKHRAFTTIDAAMEWCLE